MGWIAPVIGAATSVAGSIKQNKKSNRTTTQTSDRTGETKGYLNPRQKRVEKIALKSLFDLIKQGPQVLQADKSLIYGDINRTHNAALPRLQSQFSSRGMGQSGSFGKAMQDLELNRMGARQRGLAGLQSQAMNRWLQSIGLSQSFLHPRRVKTSEHFEGEGIGPSQGGNMLGATGFALSQFLKNILGGGSGGPFNAGGTGGIGGDFPDYSIPGDVLDDLQG